MENIKIVLSPMYDHNTCDNIDKMSGFINQIVLMVLIYGVLPNSL